MAKREIKYTLILEHWSGQVIDVIGVYSSLEDAKAVQREYDLNRTAVTLYATPYYPAKRGRKKKVEEDDGSVQKDS